MELFSGYNNKNDFLGLDSRTKLLLFISGGLIALNCNNLVVLTIYAVFLCGLCAASGKRAFAAKSAGVFALLLFLRIVMSTQALSQGSAQIVGILISLDALALFVFPIFVSVMLLVSTTRISQFLASFSKMHLPTRIIVPVAVFFRFIPTVQEQWIGVTKAMAFRGISLSPTAVLAHPARTVEYVLVPLLFSSMSVIDELAAAALARGLDAGSNRTYYEDGSLKAIDWIVVVAIAAIVIAVFAMK